MDLQENIISDIETETKDNYTVKSFLYDEMGRVFKIKLFKPHDNLHNELVREIWLNEARQLNKLKSVTNADKYLELIHDSFIDKGVYCLIYPDHEDLYNLDEYIAEQEEANNNRRRKITKNIHWLHKDKIFSIHSRMLVWKNIQRLIEGIEILHKQGIIHRNINMHSVLYNDDKDSNISDHERFMLGGFEKSLDFNKISYKPIFSKENNIICTTHQDWHDLANFILELFGLKEIDDENRLSVFEKDFINKLQQGISKQKNVNIINVASLKNDLKSMISKLAEIDTKVLPNYSITTARVDSETFKRLKSKIEIYLEEYPTSEFNAKNLTNEDIYSFIKADLNIEEIKVFHDRGQYYIVQGKNCLYKFKEFTNDRFPNWAVSHITDMYIVGESWLNSKENLTFHGKINFVKNPFIDIDYTKISEKNSWKLQLTQLNKTRIYAEEELQCLQGLLLSFAVEVGLMEVENYLININSVDSTLHKKHTNIFVEDGSHYYSLEFKEEDNKLNGSLSKSLRLKKPFERLKRKLEQEGNTHEWLIEPNKTSKDIENHETKELRYINSLNGTYIFSATDRIEESLPNFGNERFRLYSSEQKGTKAQVERRLNTFTTLLNHSSLLSSLASPASNFFVSSREFEINEILKHFDESKKEVFHSLIKTQPNYFVEGPPGVGKTFLITNYVKHLFEEERSTKLLLSAQAHATVKILYDAVTNTIDQNDLIIIKNFKDGSESDEDDNKSVIYQTTESYVEQFFNSEMYQKNKSNKTIKNKLNTFKNRPDRSFFNHILRSANLVFTTSNSSVMSSLVRDDINFDVSIMEESAKASGLELISPMITANKRVLIGDYKQLPAFSEQTIHNIITHPETTDITLLIKQLEKIGLKKSILVELEMNFQDNNRSNINMLKNMKRYFSLFQSLSEDAEEIRNRGQTSFGNILNIQHRMHPQIANIVSATVYDNKLITHESKVEKFNNHNPFFFKDSALQGLNTDNAIIWVDIPDKCSNTSMPNFEKNYVNQKEISVIKELLSKITSRDDKKYSIKVLSPYSKQVNMINTQIDKTKIDGCFSNYLATEQHLANTVDAFQGNEADIIIVSMVRHNNFTPIKSALGFLSDMRRMNVLLSRAKYKMIIVGCFGLFHSWHNLERDEQQNDRSSLSTRDKEFLDNFIDFCQADFMLMQDVTQRPHEKIYSHVNFVSTKEFLEI